MLLLFLALCNLLRRLIKIHPIWKILFFVFLIYSSFLFIRLLMKEREVLKDIIFLLFPRLVLFCFYTFSVNWIFFLQMVNHIILWLFVGIVIIEKISEVIKTHFRRWVFIRFRFIGLLGKDIERFLWGFGLFKVLNRFVEEVISKQIIDIIIDRLIVRWYWQWLIWLIIIVKTKSIIPNRWFWAQFQIFLNGVLIICII